MCNYISISFTHFDISNADFYIFLLRGAYERPEKYVPKNKTIKINKLYK